MLRGIRRGKGRKGGNQCFRLLYGGYFGVCSLFPFGVLILCRRCPPAPPPGAFRKNRKPDPEPKKLNLSIHDPSGKRRQDSFLFLWTAFHFGFVKRLRSRVVSLDTASILTFILV